MDQFLKNVVISYNTARYLYRFRIGIIKRLLERQYKVTVIAPWDEYSLKLKELGCEVYSIKIDNKGSNPIVDAMTLLQYYRLYRNLQPDIALHFTIKPNIYGTLAARLVGVPCINMVTGLGTAFIRDSWLTRTVEKLYKISFKWPYKIFFQNSDDLDLFICRGLVASNKAEKLASSGINLELFLAAPLVTNKHPIFLFIGRILKDKGVLEYVEAARLLKKKYPKVRFQLLGQLNVENRTAIRRDQVNNWVTEEIVEYLGITDDVIPFISQANCIVLPSYREGLSRTLLEASAMARPIVTSDVTGCREIVNEGENGYLCKPKDPMDLAFKLEQMLMLSDEERAEMGRKGREKMRREFDERLIVQRYIDIVEEAIKRKGEKL